MHPPDPNPSLNPPSSWINLLSQDKWTTHRLPLAFVFDCCVCCVYPRLRCVQPPRLLSFIIHGEDVSSLIWCAARTCCHRLCPDAPVNCIHPNAYSLPKYIGKRGQWVWVSVVGWVGRSTRFAGGIVNVDNNRVIDTLKNTLTNGPTGRYIATTHRRTL